MKFLEREQRFSSGELDKKNNHIVEKLSNIKETQAVPAKTLFQFYDKEKANIENVCVHIVNCYLNRQEKNK